MNSAACVKQYSHEMLVSKQQMNKETSHILLFSC